MSRALALEARREVVIDLVVVESLLELAEFRVRFDDGNSTPAMPSMDSVVSL